MSQLTNYAENQIADFFRAQAMTLPDSWFLAPLSEATESTETFTEISGIGLTRFEIERALANWAGTQGDGTTVPSSGTSHRTSNNVEIDFGTATGGATMVAVGLFDAEVGGNCWMVWEPSAPVAISDTDDVTLAEGVVKFELGLTTGLSDYLANRMIDLIFRAQAYTFPASIFHALYTVAPTNAGGGTEVVGGVGYARAELEASLAGLSGTQGPGTLVASTGTDGRISNNAQVIHPTPTGTWGTIVAGGWKDAAAVGNLLFWGPLTPMTIVAASPAPTYHVDTFGITIA